MALVSSHSDFEAQESKICHCFHCFLMYLPWSDGAGCHGFVFWMLSFKPAFSLSSFTLISSVQFSSVAQSRPTLCDPMDHRTPGLPVYHQLLELAQTHVHWVSDAIHSSSVVPFSSCLQSFPASGSFQTSHFFASGGQSIGVLASVSVLPMNIQDWFPLGLTGWISLQSKGLSRIFSNTIVQKHQFFCAQLSL